MKRIKNLKEIRLKLEFIDPSTGYKYNAKYPAFINLIDHITMYRKINNLEEIENVELLVESYLCELRENASFVVETADNLPLKLDQYLTGLKVLLKTLSAKYTDEGAFVSDELANARAERCVKCRYNTTGIKDFTLFEKISRKLAGVVIGKGHLKYDSFLGQCILCGCGLKEKVRLRKQMFIGDMKDNVKITLPNNNMRDIENNLMKCWQIDEDLLGD